ncbi:hypothetical protein BC477_11150 [Clavibacter michiganensis subsp. michiganensis]|uniref:Uncharacterized protein n=1 Tax=Clavibacter michiganensis subsp. michiganensis TaxID=33013 RepID=A0A251XI78_CLAMM|nr:hypothetical protein BC477_11150 [Clavibacter michiganensis subsp. michiganensis]OUE02351.1 hypothetical protein CMMCAS07_10065 [Clavibacter michiganensis subsp. michiganensis]
MLDSTDRIQTSHAGSLPRTDALIAANAARADSRKAVIVGGGASSAQAPDPADDGLDAVLADAVDGLVARQREVGITVPGDGEYGKAMSSAIDYGAWWSYSFQRLGGLELVPGGPFSSEPVRSTPGHVRLTTFPTAATGRSSPTPTAIRRAESPWAMRRSSSRAPPGRSPTRATTPSRPTSRT